MTVKGQSGAEKSVLFLGVEKKSVLDNDAFSLDSITSELLS